MHITKKGSTYEVESSTRKGTYYTVNLVKKTCTCPAYLYRYSKVGLLCKHIEAVIEEQGEGNDGKELLHLIQKERSINTIKAIETFGEEAVNDLISRGDIIEKDGKLTIME